VELFRLSTGHKKGIAFRQKEKWDNQMKVNAEEYFFHHPVGFFIVCVGKNGI
jgi:hypothetical protein